LQYKSQLSSEENRSTIEEEHQPAHSTKQQYNRKKSHTNKRGNFQHSICTRLPQQESSKKHNNNNNSENNNFSRKSKTRLGNGRSNNNKSNSKVENYNCTKKNANSSHNKLDTNAKCKPNASKRVLLDDSHVRRAAESNFLPDCFIAKGIRGLRSEQLVSKYRGIINGELQKVDEVIIHVGSDDIGKGMIG